MSKDNKENEINETEEKKEIENDILEEEVTKSEKIFKEALMAYMLLSKEERMDIDLFDMFKDLVDKYDCSEEEKNQIYKQIFQVVGGKNTKKRKRIFKLRQILGDIVDFFSIFVKEYKILIYVILLYSILLALFSNMIKFESMMYFAVFAISISLFRYIVFILSAMYMKPSITIFSHIMLWVIYYFMGDNFEQFRFAKYSYFILYCISYELLMILLVVLKRKKRMKKV